MFLNARIDSAKAAAKAFVDLFEDQHRVGLISFATDVTLDKGLTYMNSAGKAALKAAIDSIEAGGWTNVGDAVRAANHELQTYGRGSRGVEALLSDGLPNRPLGLPYPPGPVGYAITAADTARILGIPIYTIGLALSIQEGIDLLQTMADITGAIYYDSPTPNELRDIFQEIGGEVLCQAGRDLTVIEVLQNTFSIDGIFTIPPASILVNPIIGTTLQWNLEELFVGDVWTVSFGITSAQTGTSLPVDVSGSSKVTYMRNGDQMEEPFPQAFVTVNPCEAPPEGPMLEATKTDYLYGDKDGNGMPSPGDTLKYVVEITNMGDVTALGVTFVDTLDPEVHLIVGSVSSSQGSIVMGNEKVHHVSSPGRVCLLGEHSDWAAEYSIHKGHCLGVGTDQCIKAEVRPSDGFHVESLIPDERGRPSGRTRKNSWTAYIKWTAEIIRSIHCWHLMIQRPCSISWPRPKARGSNDESPTTSPNSGGLKSN